MKLRFIGTDGSMGLKHGGVYDVYIHTIGPYIELIFKGGKTCPYESPQALAANWERGDE